jgi:hypothetical protein
MTLSLSAARREWTRADIVLRVLNGLAALAAGGFAIQALVDPKQPAPFIATSSGAEFYSEFYAARALPLTVVLLVMLVAATRGWLVPVLVVAGLVQVCDVIIGISWSQGGIAVGAGIAAVIHLFTAYRFQTQGR